MVKRRIVEVKEWNRIYYKIQERFLCFWFWVDETDWYYWFTYTYNTLKEAEKIIKWRLDFENKTEKVIKIF